MALPPRLEIKPDILRQVERRLPGLRIENITFESAVCGYGVGSFHDMQLCLVYERYGHRRPVYAAELKLCDGDEELCCTKISGGTPEVDLNDLPWDELFCDLFRNLVRIDRLWRFAGQTVPTYSWLHRTPGLPMVYSRWGATPKQAYHQIRAEMDARDFRNACINPVPLMPDPLAPFGDPLKFEILAE